MKHSEMVAKIAEADQGKRSGLTAPQISRVLKAMQARCNCIDFLRTLVGYLFRGAKNKES